MFTAREVIDGARAMHAAFDDRTFPDPVCFDWLAGFVRRTRRRLIAKYPEILLSQAVFSGANWPPSPFEQGVLVADAEYVHSVTALSSETHSDVVALLPLDHLYDTGMWPAAVWVGGEYQRLYLKGTADDWKQYASLVVTYVALPVALTTPDDEVGLPAPWLDVCLTELAVFMAMRGGREVVGAEQAQYLMAQAQEASALAEQSLAAQRGAEVFRIRERA